MKAGVLGDHLTNGALRNSPIDWTPPPGYPTQITPDGRVVAVLYSYPTSIVADRLRMGPRPQIVHLNFTSHRDRLPTMRMSIDYLADETSRRRRPEPVARPLLPR